MGFLDDIKRKYDQGNLAVKLIFINVAIFILVQILEGLNGSGFWIEILGLNSDWGQFIVKPWTLFTYMFLHIRGMHLLFNMIMLWVIGDFFYRYFGDKGFAQFYFFGGISGGILYLFLSPVFPQLSGLLMGASAAIYSVLFAMVAYQPDLRVRLLFVSQPIKLLHVAIGFIVLGFLLNGDNLGGNISHVGGAIFGYFYMKRFEKGLGFNGGLFDVFKSKKNFQFSKRKNSKNNLNTNTPPKRDEDYADWKKNKENKTNHILEKISRSGYNSLTEEEKAFLFNQRGNNK